ncbi:transposase [Pedobacter chinensis]|nr:transposase [Pedobacter chinensis]
MTTDRTNEYGIIANNEWINLSERFSNFDLDVFQIMPNHMHGIIILSDIGATLAVAQEEKDELTRATARVAPTIGAYKSIVSNSCLQLFKLQNRSMGKLWQRNYYEHIILDENAYYNISNYIINNSANGPKTSSIIKQNSSIYKN